MKGTKYLSEIIDISKLKDKSLNIIKAPTGCGKTYFALNTIASLCEDTIHEAVYLIDTINGREQILNNYNAYPVDNGWIHDIELDGMWFQKDNHIVIMTYAKFGVILVEDPDFYKHFKYIICDEMHSAFKFQYYDNKPTNSHRIAISGLKRAIRFEGTKVIALTATPKRMIRELTLSDVSCYDVPIDQDDLIHFDTKNVVRFSDIYNLIRTTDTNQTGVLYTCRIEAMREYEKIARESGFRPISLWSVNNEIHDMNEEQLMVRDRILNDYEIPSGYNFLIINSASETSIKIKSHVDFMIINSTELDTQTQVRGRVNRDIETIYLPMTKETIVVPERFLNKTLYKKDKTELCQYLNLRNSNNRPLGWNSVCESLSRENSGYRVIHVRDGNLRCAVIQKKETN